MVQNWTKLWTKLLDKIHNWTKLWTKLIVGQKLWTKLKIVDKIKNCGQN